MAQPKNTSRFNIVSQSGDGMGIAMRLQEEGEDVRLFIYDEEANEVGDGLVTKVGDLTDLLTDADTDKDIFVFDGTGHGVLADSLAGGGFDIIGDSYFADRLERDREFALAVMDDSGIDVPERVHYEDWDQAKKAAKKQKGRSVYKPSKQLGEVSGSYVSYGPEDMVEFLTNTEEQTNINQPEFVLQDFVEGVAISSEAWFAGERFLPLFNHTLERKAFMNDNIGPSGGCVGNVVWSCDGHCPICEAGVRKLQPFLNEVGYVGPIDLNAIVGEDGKLFGLEFTPRFGYDAFPTVACELLAGTLGNLFADVARRQFGYSGEVRLREDVFASAIRITIPPWPSEKHEAEKNIPIRGLERNDFTHTFLYNVKESEEKLYSAGAWGIIGLFTGSGTSIARGFSRPYEMAERVRLPDKQYRTDLVSQFKKDFEAIDGISSKRLSAKA